MFPWIIAWERNKVVVWMVEASKAFRYENPCTNRNKEMEVQRWKNPATTSFWKSATSATSVAWSIGFWRNLDGQTRQYHSKTLQHESASVRDHIELLDWETKWHWVQFEALAFRYEVSYNNSKKENWVLIGSLQCISSPKSATSAAFVLYHRNILLCRDLARGGGSSFMELCNHRVCA